MIRSSACQPWQPDLPGHAGDRGDLLSYTTPRDTITERVTAPVRFAETAIARPVNKLAVEAIFVVPENSSLAKAGCALRYADGDVECTGNPGPVGALLADGRRFDLALPFSFPFTEIVKE